MKTLIFLISVEALVLALLQHPSLSSVLTCFAVWVAIVAFLTIRIFRCSDRLAAIIALTGMVAYSCWAIIPDKDNFTPRRNGPELTSSLLRRCYGPITGRADLDAMSSPTSLVIDASNSTDLTAPTVQLGPRGNDASDSVSSTDFESMADLINETLELDHSDPNLAIFPDNTLPQNLSGLGPYLAFQNNVQMFMWIGHAFVSMLIALTITVVGNVFKLLRVHLRLYRLPQSAV